MFYIRKVCLIPHQTQPKKPKISSDISFDSKALFIPKGDLYFELDIILLFEKKGFIFLKLIHFLLSFLRYQRRKN